MHPTFGDTLLAPCSSCLRRLHNWSSRGETGLLAKTASPLFGFKDPSRPPKLEPYRRLSSGLNFGSGALCPIKQTLTGTFSAVSALIICPGIDLPACWMHPRQRSVSALLGAKLHGLPLSVPAAHPHVYSFLSQSEPVEQAVCLAINQDDLGYDTPLLDGLVPGLLHGRSQAWGRMPFETRDGP